MAYSVKEMFYTLQGEGRQAGHAAVFLRFAGCNLWSGQEKDRQSAVCRFCDTDFVGTDGINGGKFSDAQSLVGEVDRLWGGQTQAHKLIVCTGGEPLLQLDTPLIDALHAHGWRIAVETNGTVKAPPGIDWLCVSPKSTAPLNQTQGDELKLVYPQLDAPPEAFESLSFQHFLLQPMDGPDQRANMQAAVAYCKAHPRWQLSLQTHKWLGID